MEFCFQSKLKLNVDSPERINVLIECSSALDNIYDIYKEVDTLKYMAMLGLSEKNFFHVKYRKLQSVYASLYLCMMGCNSTSLLYSTTAAVNIYMKNTI